MLRMEERTEEQDYYWILDKAGLPYPEAIENPEADIATDDASEGLVGMGGAVVSEDLLPIRNEDAATAALGSSATPF